MSPGAAGFSLRGVGESVNWRDRCCMLFGAGVVVRIARPGSAAVRRRAGPMPSERQHKRHNAPCATSRVMVGIWLFAGSPVVSLSYPVQWPQGLGTLYHDTAAAPPLLVRVDARVRSFASCLPS